MASPEDTQERKATIDRSLAAAMAILEKPEVRELLNAAGYDNIDQIIQYSYVPNLSVGKKVSKIVTPHRYRNETSIPVMASLRKETIRLDRISSTLHARQTTTLSHFATSNGLQDGDFLDKANQSIVESFNENRTLTPPSPQVEKLVSMEGSIDVASHDHRIWGRPALILVNGLYNNLYDNKPNERQEGLALIELLLHTHKTLSREPTLATNLADEEKSEQNEIADIMRRISLIAAPTKLQIPTEETSPF
jgi:hypothetical protein